MINYIWLFMLGTGIVVGAVNGRISEVTKAVMEAASNGVQLAIGLIGIMALWMGLMKIAEKSGLLKAVSWLVRPLAHLVFPSIPKGHPAVGAIVGNISANVLGLGNAATPLGLKAMQELQTLNHSSDTATPAMCTFLALNTACITLVPSTVIALRVAAGSKDPTSVIGTTVISTFITTICALVLDATFRKSFSKSTSAKSYRSTGPSLQTSRFRRSNHKYRTPHWKWPVVVFKIWRR